MAPVDLLTSRSRFSGKVGLLVSESVSVAPLGLVAVELAVLVYPVSLVPGVTRTVKLIVAVAPRANVPPAASILMLPAVVPVKPGLIVRVVTPVIVGGVRMLNPAEP